MLIQNIKTYANKLASVKQSEQQSIQQLKKSFMQQFEVQLDEALKLHQQNYNKSKHMLKQQIDTLEYYIKLHKKCYGNHKNTKQEGQQQQQHQQYQQQQNTFMNNTDTLNEWQKVTAPLNLYSLFKQIDDKLIFNRALLQDFKLVCSLPSSNSNKYSTMVQTSSILQNKCKQYQTLISNLLTKLNRPCKQQLAIFMEIQHKYAKLLNNNYKDNNAHVTEFKVKDSVQYCISSICAMKYLRVIDIQAVQNKGIMSIQTYKYLGQAIYLHRFYIKQLKIKIMDMQFCQQKCDTLKRYLKKLRVLQKLIIQNYYPECKLGNFVDFNWQPYRKAVNIKACVWK